MIAEKSEWMMWPFRKKAKSLRPPQMTEALPKFVDGRRMLMCWVHPEGTHRVFLLARPEGTYMPYAQCFSDDEWEMCWIQENRGCSIYDSAETAIGEIHIAFPWTTEVMPGKIEAQE